MELVKHAVTGAVGTVTLDDPSKRNALTATLIHELLRALAETTGAGARVIVLRGARAARPARLAERRLRS